MNTPRGPTPEEVESVINLLDDILVIAYQALTTAHKALDVLSKYGTEADHLKEEDEPQ